MLHGKLIMYFLSSYPAGNCIFRNREPEWEKGISGKITALIVVFARKDLNHILPMAEKFYSIESRRFGQDSLIFLNIYICSE